MDHIFSPEELQTFASYEKIAVERAKRRSDSQWWQNKFDYFKALVPAGHIIDIGCGNGKDAPLFSSSSDYQYVGVDISPAMLALTKEHAPQSIFMRMNIYCLAFKPACFDGFWATASLLHIPKYNISCALQEIRRIMKQRAVGFIALREGHTEEMVTTDMCGDNRFYAFYHQHEFRCLLEDNGYEVVRMGRDWREYDPHNPHSMWLFYFVRVL